MTKLEKLEQILEDYSISLHYFDLVSDVGIKGLFVETSSKNMIFLDNSLKNNVLERQEVLAHELGHFFTSSHSFFDDNKVELKADKYMINKLVDTDELTSVLNEKTSINVDELADTLNVSQKLLCKKFELLSKSMQILKLENGYIDLTALPNIYIQPNEKEVI